MKRLGIVFMLAIVLAACGQTGAATAPASPAAAIPANVAPASTALGGEPGLPAVGERAPDFEYTDAAGTRHTLGELQGKVVILNFWATWCGPCREEMPALDQIAKQYPDKVVVLGINKLEQAEQVAAYSSELGLSFPLIVNPSGDIPDRYGVRALPTTYVVRPDGMIGQWRAGALDVATFEHDISAALQ